MFFTLQFPFGDVRRFFRKDDVYLRSPTWPTPEEDRQFVRYFGAIRTRLLGGSGAKWMGDELYYCDARNAIRLPDLRTEGFSRWGNLRRVIRRLFVHRPALARVEVAFAIAPHPGCPLGGDDAFLRIRELLTINALVNDHQEDDADGLVAKPSPLLLQGRRLSRLLLCATTPMKVPPSAAIEDWALRDGEPMLLIEYGRDELTEIPKGARHIPAAETAGFSLAYTTTQLRGRSVVIWFLEGSPTGQSKVIRRALRMCLLRLHLEFQALRLNLNTIADRPEFDGNAPGRDQLEAYLDEASRRLFRKSHFGVNQAPLYAAVAAFRELISAEKRALLLNKIKSVQKQVIQRVEKVTQAPSPWGNQLPRSQKEKGNGTTMMPGVTFEEIWKAFSTGYNKKSLEQMLRFRLNIDLNSIVADGPMRDMVFDLLTQSEREGWTIDLIREGYKYNPRNQDLLIIYEKYGLSLGVSAQNAGVVVPDVQSVSDGLQKTIKARLPAFDFAVWQEKMALVEGRVCRVEIGGNAAGTGALIGSDAVLTNYHVLKTVLSGTTPASKVTCRFDYKVLADGSRVEGVAVGLHSTDWKLDSSPNSAAEDTRTPDNPPPTADELDYALIRLAHRIGDEPAAPKGGDEAPRRGWLVVPTVAAVFVPKMPIMIAQHPDGKPLKLAVDTEAVIGTNTSRNRVRYSTNTEAGSSGSPVFDLDWNLVALHHLGDPAYDHPPSYNQGIPIDKIRDRIEKQGRAEALGK